MQQFVIYDLGLRYNSLSLSLEKCHSCISDNNNVNLLPNKVSCDKF